jgi:hypothetical protein
MRSQFLLIPAVVILSGALIGCQSHEAKTSDLQKEYDQAAQQFRTDCTAETLNMPKQLSPKCAEEQKRMNDAYQRLQAEQRKN